MADSNTYDYTQNYDLPYPNDANEDADLIENLEKLAEAVDAALGGKYTKPTGGIPKTDLSSSVQASLGKADTSLQSSDISSSITSSSTNSQVAGAKAVYDIVGDIESALQILDTGSGV